MRNLESIDFAELKAAAKELNDLGILKDKIKIIGSGKEAVLAAFVASIENGVSEADEEKLTETIINQYNFVTGDDEADAGKEAEKEKAPEKAKEVPAKEPKPAKEGKPAKEPKPAKEAKPPKEPKAKKDRTLVINSTEGSKAGEVEKLMSRPEGVTQAEVTELIPDYGIKLAALVKWERDKGAVIDAKEGRFWYRADGKLQFPIEAKPVKEAKPAKEPKPEKPAKEEKPAKPAKEEKPAK